jgi:hypothetical protein
MDLTVESELVYWRGPAPWYFFDLGPEASGEIAEVAPLLTYGWGVIPVAARIGSVAFTTSERSLRQAPVELGAARRQLGLEPVEGVLGEAAGVGIRLSP